ncbi:MAG: sensor histidine kinase KdpD [Ignavibacteriales bacterium]|nr:MAG: sensor histidine kinase KdpD [Ignavibacteriales bacterium]
MINSDQPRPDPDRLLEIIKKEEEKGKRGKLKIFFGMCAGVGKTYSLLESAHKAKRNGIDVVIGLIETHKREDTQKLVYGLEQIPLSDISYRDTVFKEMNLDEVLKRKPQLVIIDELAHTNIPGSRHLKRYQDVIEILENGIDVYTTLNVQHLESRAETVRQITGSVIRETVPDSILERADEIELIDLTPEELLQRLAEGKVYTEEKSQQAIKNFFRLGNLTALREMALRLTAERVDYQLRDYKAGKKIDGTWKSGQRLMVAIGPGPYSAQLIRWTRRLAYTMEASWLAVYVETDPGISEKNQNILTQNFNLAKELGAEVITTSGIDIVNTLIQVAKENNVTQIIVGKSRAREFPVRKHLIEKLLKQSGDIDVYVVGGEKQEAKSYKDKEIFSKLILVPSSGIKQYLLATFIIIAVFILSYLAKNEIGYLAVSLFLLFIISLMPLFNFGRGPIILSAFLSALGWNYFFIPPQFTFHIEKPEDILMFTMFFIIALVNGIMTSKLRTQEKFVRHREEKTNALNNLLKQLSGAVSINDVSEIAVKSIRNYFNLETIIFYSTDDKKLSPLPHNASSINITDKEWYVAQWCFLNRKNAGKTTSTLPFSDIFFIPLTGTRTTLGAIGFKVEKSLSFEQKSFLESFVAQIVNAIEREYLTDLSKNTYALSESEKLYKTLFNSISHELKTPITALIGAASSLTEKVILENKNITKNLINEIGVASERLKRLVDNLLDMARLESGQLKIKPEWNDINDLINSVIKRVVTEENKSRIINEIDLSVHLVKFDFGLLEQAITNIIHNCIAYSPDNAMICIHINKEDSFCVIRITDEGPGFPDNSIDRLFEKFYRVPGSKTGGTGLGLSISKGFIEAHKGTITARNRTSGGAEFIIKIPLGDKE